MHNSLEEFEFRSDHMTDYGGTCSCPRASATFMFSFFSVAIEPIYFKFSGNKDVYNISHQFKFRLDRNTDYGGICH